MALSSSEKTYIRDMSGDDLTANDGTYEVSDTILQEIYDDADQGNSDLNKTVFYVILRRWGKAARLVSLSGEFGNAAHNQKFDQLERLLKLWSDRTGISIKRVISAEAGHVYRADSRQTEAPDYSSGTVGSDEDRYIIINY